MKKINLALCTLAILATSACSTQTYLMKDTTNKMEKETRQDFFVYGIGQEKTLDAAEICGGTNKIAKVQTELSVVDGLLGFLTYGIYAPREAKVFCTK